MSASEKLKRLDLTNAEHVQIYDDALSEIRAVVELAERNVRNYDEMLRNRTGTSSSGEREHFKETRAALTALSEKLGDADPFSPSDIQHAE